MMKEVIKLYDVKPSFKRIKKKNIIIEIVFLIFSCYE